jgi:mRNA interferase RelE/StbE
VSCNLEVKGPAIDFIRRLPPIPRKALRNALAELREERGDINSLEDPLTGYNRLRVGKYRVIFRYVENMTIEVVFVEDRKLVYDVFEEQLALRLKSPSP